jgi:formylglycine-generating enzyme required for sulfatase activity
LNFALSFAACLAMLSEARAQGGETNSYLLVQTVPGNSGVVQLTVYGYPGSSNQVQFADSLDQGVSWTGITNLVATTGTMVVYDTNSSATGSRFYRALVLGAPWPFAASNYVWIPPGQFLMGSPSTEQDRNSDEAPQMLVTLPRGFYMGKYLVTQGDYLALMGNNPSYFAGDTNRPVEACDWLNATNYCAKLTALESNAGRLPTGWSYRLPTEAEWEYACRAGTTTRFSYGDDPGYTNLTNYAWYDANSYSTNKPPGTSYFVIGRYYTTHPVGQKLPNPWGLYDMYGEVSEWCQDWFGTYPGGTQVNPQGPSTGDERVVRSGSWLDDPYSLRSAFRYSVPPDNISGVYGFRVVLGVTQY